MFHLTFPNISHKSAYLAMLDEWKAFEPTPTSPRKLFAWEDYEDFLRIISDDLNDKERELNSTLFFFMENKVILGALQLRHHINHPNCSLEWKCGGHIGYGLRPSVRGKWLAKVMLSLGLIEARKIGIEKVLISAHSNNIPSWKTIEWLGGVFVKEIDDEEKKLKVYWISLL